MIFVEAAPQDLPEPVDERLATFFEAAQTLAWPRPGDKAQVAEFRPAIGMLSDGVHSSRKVPAALYGDASGAVTAPHRVFLLGPPGPWLFAGEEVSEGLRDYGACVVVAEPPRILGEVLTLSSVGLSGNPERLLVVDALDTVSDVSRKILEQQVDHRNREAERVGKTENARRAVGFELVGSEQLDPLRTRSVTAQDIVELLRSRLSATPPRRAHAVGNQGRPDPSGQPTTPPRTIRPGRRSWSPR